MENLESLISVSKKTVCFFFRLINSKNVFNCFIFWLYKAITTEQIQYAQLKKTLRKSDLIALFVRYIFKFFLV